MSRSIVRQLIVKDLMIMKAPAVWYFLGGIAAILFAIFSENVANFIAQILFVTVLFGAGIHAAMRTVVEERREQNLPFIMSLPVTIMDYTRAKLIANLLLFGGLWLVLSGASYAIFFRGAWTFGAIPYFTIILVAILLGYVAILTTTIVFESVAAAVVAIVGANLGSQAYLWWITSFYGFRSTIYGDSPVWNGTYLTVLAVQIATIIGLIVATLLVQSRKTEFL